MSGIDYGMCLRQTHLDAALLRTASTLGADIRQQCRATGSIWTDNRVVGLTYTDADDREHTATAPIVIGADGRKSIVAREVGAETLISSRSGRSCYFTY